MLLTKLKEVRRVSNQKDHILLLGTRDKTDFALYLSNVIANLDKRVLLVDATEKQLYRHGYTTLSGDQHLYDFHGVDILTGAVDWSHINILLKNENEQLANYDVVLLDIDSVHRANANWSGANTQIYVGDYERLTMERDKHLINSYIETNKNNKFQQVTYYVKTTIDPEYFDDLIGYCVDWQGLPIEIEYDEIDLALRIAMQHQMKFSFKKLSKGYREGLTEIVTAIYGFHKNEVQRIFKQSLFKQPTHLLATADK
jgi:hypothetical protein